ncbi:uncharacterized protein [Aegilops tauschii subsp. strangulata]|uniref:uncharacterized protein n=1 Tax=Aegilops tauschii subsp. strangulata TaxID=200361 RepID=UPI001ABCC3CF|nr:uncharacterized protein LOC109745188 isoform X2 [Aegilops tauschii subsp. strangulata]XP_044374713.1 uncharacterized protein LOC123097003 isoform X2 [Triticum aestivum]
MTVKHSPRSPGTAVLSHPARSGARSHQSPPATLPPWLGFQASAPAPVAMSSSSCPTCMEESLVDSLAAAQDKAAMELPPPRPAMASGSHEEVEKGRQQLVQIQNIYG